MRLPDEWYRVERLWSLFPFVAVLSFGLRQTAPPLDFWWHLKAGQLIWESGTIPRTDLFSFTAAGQPFVLQNWLTELVYFGLYSVGDLELVLFFHALLLTSSLVPLYLLCRSTTPSARWAAWGTTVGALYLIAFATPRPQTCSIALFSLCCLILRRHQAGRALWLVPILTMIWSNLHGAFPLGLALVGLSLGHQLMLALYTADPTARSHRLRSAGRLLIALVLSLLATCLNPEGPWVWKYFHSVATDDASRTYVTEWQPPRFGSLAGTALLYAPLAGVVVCFGELRQRVCRLDTLLFVTFACLAASATRNLVWFGLVAAPLFARVGPELPWRDLIPPGWRSAAAFRPTVARAPNRLLGTAVLLGFVAATVPMVPWLRPLLRSLPREEVLLHPEIAAGGVEFIRNHRLEGRIFNDQKFGDYMIWRLWPEQKTFIDGRVHLFGRKLVEDYILIPRDTCWDSRLAEYGIRYLFVRRDSELARKAGQSEDWVTLFEDGNSVILEIRRP